MAEYNSFNFNGTRSSTYGLYLTQPPSISVPIRRITRETVPGRSGTLIIDGGGYEDVAVVYSVNAKFRKTEVEYNVRGLKAWLLHTPGLFTLTDSYDPLYFRYGTYEGGTEFENIFNHGARGSILFTCQPFKMSYIGQQMASLAKQGSIHNPEAFESQPYLKVYGSGNGELYINNTTVYLTGISSYIELDTSIEQAFKGEANQNSKVTIGDWPVFTPGENVIQWSGGITKIDYIPRWCTL